MINKWILISTLFALTGVIQASEFAGTVVTSSGIFGAYPYNDSGAVLGEPASWIYDDDTYFDNFACSLVYAAWNVTPAGDNVVVTLGAGSLIVAGFDHKVIDDPDNPYGIDLIVFGNSAFITKSPVTPDSDMDTLQITAPARLIGEKVKVEVAQEPNGPWLAFSRGPWGDNLFPTNRFAWDSAAKKWGQPLNPLRPVNPNLELSDFSNVTVSQAISLYDGSAGGAGFDLQWLNPVDYQSLSVDSQTGRRWIRYVRLSYAGSTPGEIDAVADVAPADVPKFPAGDSNYDYRVDIRDFVIMAQNWLACTWNCDI